MDRRNPRARRGSVEVNEFVRQQALAGNGAAAILRAVEAKYPGLAPSQRKVEEIVREWRPRQADEAWSIADANPDEAAAVVPVLGAVLLHSVGEIRSVSNEEAEWIRTIRAIAPDLDDLWDVYRLARDATGGLVQDVLWYLALAPWREGTPYARAYAEGWIDGVRLRYETPGEALGVVTRNER